MYSTVLQKKDLFIAKWSDLIINTYIFPRLFCSFDWFFWPCYNSNFPKANLSLGSIYNNQNCS